MKIANCICVGDPLSLALNGHSICIPLLGKPLLADSDEFFDFLQTKVGPPPPALFWKFSGNYFPKFRKYPPKIHQKCTKKCHIII